jgi:hypothetical protein
MLALLGHMSRALLERYSHIRMAAKREAMDGIYYSRKEVAGCGCYKICYRVTQRRSSIVCN